MCYLPEAILVAGILFTLSHGSGWWLLSRKNNDLYTLGLIYYIGGKIIHFLIVYYLFICAFLHLLQVAAYNSEGKSNPSQVVEFITKPDIPGCPFKPVIRGRVLPNSFKMAWGKFSTSCPFDLLKPFTLHVVDSLASPVCKFIFLTELCLDLCDG